MLARTEHTLVQAQEIAAAELPAAYRATFHDGRSLEIGTPTTTLPSAKQRKLARHEERAKSSGDTRKLTGRPSDFTVDEGDSICAWIQAGGSLRKYCLHTGRPAITVYRWMREDASFAARYARACEDRSDTLADEMIEIGDEAAVNPSIEGVAAAKLRVETRKWIASKLRPQKWGDKQVVEHAGAISIRIGIPSKAPETPLPLVVEMPEVLERKAGRHDSSD